jgi:hypothetical protein
MSNTELSFVEFNGFNYAEANSVNIQNAYANGIRLSRVTDISDSDIILLGRGDLAVAAIQIIAVTDPVGVQEDKYTFSIKRIEGR